jgi:hypothetical protein
MRTTPASVLRSAIPMASKPERSAAWTSSIASDAPRRKENGELTPSSTNGDGVVGGGGMSLVRTSLSREKPTFSGTALYPGEGRGPGRCDEQRFPLPWTPAFAGELAAQHHPNSP